MRILKTILELAAHRNYCLNCREPLKFIVCDRNNTNTFNDINIDIMDNYIRIHKPDSYEIRLDKEGRYQLYPNTSDIITSLKHATLTYSFLTLRKTCSVCNGSHVPISFKHLLPGFRGVNDMSFFELLILFDAERKTYSISMIKDVNVCYEDGFLYIIDCMEYSSILTIKGSNYFFCESAPKLDLRDFKTSEGMIQYLKMVMAFS